MARSISNMMLQAGTRPRSELPIGSVGGNETPGGNQAHRDGDLFNAVGECFA